MNVCVCACVSECESVCKNVKETSLICLQAAFSCFDDGEKEKTLKERHTVTKICRLVNCCGTAVNYWVNTRGARFEVLYSDSVVMGSIPDSNRFFI